MVPVLPLPTHTLNAVSQAEWLVLATLRSCPTIRVLLFGQEVNPCVIQYGKWAVMFSKLLSGPDLSLLFLWAPRNAFSTLLSCKVITVAQGLSMSLPRAISVVFSSPAVIAFSE